MLLAMVMTTVGCREINTRLNGQLVPLNRHGMAKEMCWDAAFCLAQTMDYPFSSRQMEFNVVNLNLRLLAL
jgi:hypothetical protein